ncbi:ROK family transcriptional regulator [Psychrobacillus sp. NEAU-3TGS]|uniref:ROK family transcriptional regulator n=1 Tax=Psychrobacillus sp. NEAU-3TGS TaxID=2995412 RepID=UPI002498E517|nr:ROK family transcriptional regulator [Psychrobacillus sp. NEAU-3TGS]MDI2587840.1 ROK family transcriptional regulator [Psychrobacillus sp. NEAU-3TGS]
MEKQDQILMKKQNKTYVLELIKNMAPISRMQISKITKMSPTSITRIVGELQEQGFVKETKSVTSGVGRRATLLDICGDVLFTIGVELDKAVLKIGIVNYVGEVVDLQTHVRNPLESYEETVQNINNKVKNIIKLNEIPMEKIIGLAVGLPGSIDYENGIVRLAEQLRWKNVHLMRDLSKLSSLNVVIDNELKMKIIAENTVGKAKDSKSSILVGIGSGIGAAILLNGEVHRGESNNAGEIGHTVIDPNGNVCSCGKFGCLCTYISEGAILADAKKMKDISSIDEVFGAFRDGESWAHNILDRTATYIALAISNLACLYEPECIILSGNLIDKMPEMTGQIVEKCERYMWEPIKKNLQIVHSSLGSQGVVLGAAIQAQNSLFDIN